MMNGDQSSMYRQSHGSVLARCMARACRGLLGAALVLGATAAQATGILFDNAVAMASLDPTSFSLRGSGVAWDGTSYWAAKLGNASPPTLAQYDAAGNRVNTFSTGIDSRGIFTDGAGNLYSTAFSTGDVFDITGGSSTFLYSIATPSSQSKTALRVANNTLYTMDNGTVHLFDFANGNALGTITLSGFSAGFPAQYQIAIADDVLLTYDDLGTVGAWDFSGNLLGESMIGLNTLDQTWSFSYANGLAWIEQDQNQPWTGFDIGLRASDVPAPMTLMLVATGLVAFGARCRRRRH